jgi:pentatricopeptide repeat protein
MKRSFMLVGLAGLLAAAPAAAQVKYPRKVKDIKVEQTERTKKIEPKEKPAAPEASITADKFFAVQGQLQKDYDALIATYKEQLREIPPDDPLRLDYGFRLAEALAQQFRFYHSMSLEAQIKADKAATPKEKADQQAVIKQNDEHANVALKEAVSAYRTLADNPKLSTYPQGDEVFFYYGYTLQQAGYPQQAGDIYLKLIKNFQGSRFVPEAYLYFADRYFETRDLGNAEAFYNKVLQFPKSPVYPYALYKRGWTYYNEKRLDEAGKAFRETVHLTDGNKLYEPMNKAAKKDFVRVFAESDAPVNTAYQAFQALDKTDYSFKMLGYLADYYMDEGKGDKAIYTFHQMMSMKPRDPLVCEWQYNIARATISYYPNPDKIRELSNLVKLYSAVRTWSPAMPKQQLDECRENAAGVTGELAMLWHAEGLKTLNQQTLDNAEALYHVYLDSFHDAENALTMQINYAELLWSLASMERDSKKQQARWEATAGEHSRVVQWPGVAEAQRKDSAYATVLAWKNALAVDVGAEAPDWQASSGAPAAEPIPDKEQKMMQAFDVYLKYITDKKDVERTSILFFTGRLYWKHNHFDEAVKYLSEVVTEHPEDDVAEFAANILLDSLNKAGRHDEMLDWVRRMHENAALMKAHPNLKPSLDRLYVQGEWNQALAQEKRGDYRACGLAYDKLQRDNPNDPKINEILFNAALCFKKAKMLGYAIQYRMKLTDPNRPGSSTDPLAQKAKLYLGDDFSSIAYYEKAAEQYEEYAQKFQREKDAPQALYYALVYRKGLGQDQQAIKDTEAFIKTFAKDEPSRAAGAFYSIANIYEKNANAAHVQGHEEEARKETDKMIGHLENYLRQWGDKGGVDYEVVAHVRAGEALWKASCPVKAEKGSCIAISRERALRQASGKKHKATTTQTQCGDVSKNKITVYERKGNLVAQAQKHFTAAVDLWKRSGPAKISGRDEADKAQRTADAIRWAAAAQFYLAEAKYEQFLGLKFPTGLNFDPAKQAKLKDSQKRFGAWYDQKTKLAAGVNAAYRAIVDTATSGGASINAAQWAIAGAARMGEVLENFSDALFTAEIPKDVQQFQDAVDAYCDELTNRADPLEKKAIEAFSFCLDNSNKLSWFNEWSQLCEAELAQIRPQDFPAAGEIRAQPDNVPMTIDTQPIVTEIVTAAPAAKGAN